MALRCERPHCTVRRQPRAASRAAHGSASSSCCTSWPQGGAAVPTRGGGVRNLVLSHDEAAVCQLSAQRDVLLCRAGGRHSGGKLQRSDTPPRTTKGHRLASATSTHALSSPPFRVVCSLPACRDALKPHSTRLGRPPVQMAGSTSEPSGMRATREKRKMAASRDLPAGGGGRATVS